MRLILLLAIMSTAPAWAASVPIQKEFRNWVVTCDNVRSCVAEGADQDNPSLIVRFTREAGPHDGVSMEIYGSDNDSAHLRLDGKPIPVAKEDWATDGSDEEASLNTNSQGEVHKLVDAMRNARKLASGEATVSLDGLTAALLLIDEVQGRIDTDTAWIRRGYRLPDVVPPAPSLPVVKAVAYQGPGLTPAQSVAVSKSARALAAKTANPDCDLDPANDQPSADATRLNNNEALVLVECSRGAYQSGFQVFRVPLSTGQARAIALPVLSGQPAQTVLFNAEFDAAKGILSQYIKGRGIGDCGESAQWAFDGRDFVLTAMTSQPRCPGILLDFPPLWRSR